MRTIRFPAAVILLGLAAGTALAVHLRLTKSEPASDAVLDQPPAEVRLWFSEKPQAAVSAIRLSGPAGVAKLAVVQPGPDSMAISARVESRLEPGAYTVSWRTAGRDGHPLRGEFAFTISPSGDDPR
ncbi:MAG TPA: copper resistance CopC family protein [Gemmatimonadales bacterium]|nr:copper resistance CopC family protein [Gemmatimonadales bacterium]